MSEEQSPGDGSDGSDGGPGAVGSVGEEAAKLFSALQDWAQESGAGTSPPAGATEAGGAFVGDQFRLLNEHLAGGGKECTVCPLCQVINKVRGANPEVKTHLAVATSSLLQAAAALLESRAAGGSKQPEPVTKIDLDDEPEHPGAPGDPLGDQH